MEKMLLLAALLLAVSGPAASASASAAKVAVAGATPHYKPSSRSPEPLDITSNAYGFSRTAPAALEIGASVPEFTLPRAGGGSTSLAARRAQGNVVLIFYRGHW